MASQPKNFTLFYVQVQADNIIVKQGIFSRFSISLKYMIYSYVNDEKNFRYHFCMCEVMRVYVYVCLFLNIMMNRLVKRYKLYNTATTCLINMDCYFFCFAYLFVIFKLLFIFLYFFFSLSLFHLFSVATSITVNGNMC